MPRAHGPAPGLEDVIAGGLTELGLQSSPEQHGRLAELARLVEAWGARINLTGHRDAEAVARRLVLDAAALLTALPAFDSLADLGSGAGFPGLPMAVLRPRMRVVLVEARERRHHFQRHAIRVLGLANVRAVRGRIEEVAAERCQAVIAQAVAAPEHLVDWMLRWAQPGALLIVPGGTSPRTAGSRRQQILEERSASYRAPLGGPERTVWLARAPSSPFVQEQV